MRENQIEERRLIRSFVRRDGRITEAQCQAWQRLWPTFGLELHNGLLEPVTIFNRAAPLIIEIGFGAGHSLLANAKAHPELDFIGIETHRPGIGILLQGLENEKITNTRIYYADAVQVLQKAIPDHGVLGVNVFFPDPWRKRRHHKRRLIQPEFVRLIARKLQVGGTLHLATDWEDYAVQMMKVLSGSEEWINLAGVGQFASRSIYRPVITKFERRGETAGHGIWELQFSLGKM